MSKTSVTLIGGGIAGLTLADELLRDPETKLCLIDKQRYRVSPAELIRCPDDLSGKVDLQEWSEKRKIKFIQGKLERVSAKRHKIYLKDAEPIDYERLVIATGLVSKKISVKGEHREGFFYLSDLEALKLRDFLKISQEAAVYFSTWLGIALAFALKAAGKEVRLIGESLDFLGESKQKVIDALSAKQIPLHVPATLEEAVGESMVKAVKVQPLKVFSAQMAIIDSGFLPNRDFFEEPLSVRSSFFTDFEDIFVLGDAGLSDTTGQFYGQARQEELASEAKAFAGYILNGNLPQEGQRKLLTAQDYCSIIDTFLLQIDNANKRESGDK